MKPAISFSSIILVLPLLAAIVSINTSAASLTVTPVSPTLNVGANGRVTVSISDLGLGTSPSLSTFDFNIMFNPGVLSVDTNDVDRDGVIDSVRLDPAGQLDLFGLGSNLFSAGLSAPGVLTLFGLSFDSSENLILLQEPTFIIAEINFSAVSPGNSPLRLSLKALGDENGLPLDAEISNSAIQVRGISQSAVPVPSISTWGMILLASLLGAIGSARKYGVTCISGDLR